MVLLNIAFIVSITESFTPLALTLPTFPPGIPDFVVIPFRISDDFLGMNLFRAMFVQYTTRSGVVLFGLLFRISKEDKITEFMR